MSAHTQLLDQQWRLRGLDTPVELRLDAQVSALARMKEASLNGALIATGVPLAADSMLALRPIPEAGVWLKARVVGQRDSGFVLEWVEPRLEYLAILLTERTK